MARDSEAEIRKAAMQLQIDVTKLCAALGMGGMRTGWDFDLSPAVEVKAPAVFRVRGSKQPASDAVPVWDIFDALRLPLGQTDPVVEWDGTDEWCCLDLDFHSGSVPDANLLRQAADTLRPMPHAWWVSKGGGLHVLYHRQSNATASDLAAIASVGLCERFPAATVELKCSTRQPPGEIVRCTPRIGESGPALGGSTAAGVDATAYLEDRELEVGRRYPHTQCPVNPSPRAEGNSDPVIVQEDHIYCHICAADGIRRGSKTPGYFPYSALCGTRIKSMFALCVENFTHWDHAKHIVRQLVENEVLARTYYQASLRQKHGEDKRIEGVFRAGLKTGLVRHQGFWADGEGTVIAVGGSSAILSGLPVCKFIDDQGEIKTDRKTVEILSSTVNLAPYGYPALTRVWGTQLTFMQELPADRIFTVLQKHGNPEYLPTKRRVPEEEAWRAIGALFPGFDRAAIELLIVAKGCSEFCAGLPPMIFLTGPTGAGKTQSVNLAAAICGDAARKVQFHKDRDRVFSGIAVATQGGSFAFFDEYLKSARARKVEADTAMEFVLNLAPDTLYHLLYVGQVPIGDLPVCVWADTLLPEEVITHSQLARRIHHVRLRESRQWTHNACNLRSEYGDEIVRAADSLLSWIIDRHFPPGPATDFAVVARGLGFTLLRDDEAAKDKEENIQKFFAELCKLPDTHKRGLPGAGWKEINPVVAGEIADLWHLVGSAGKVQELDLKRVLGLAVACDMETKQRKECVYVRFIDKEKGRVNAGLR